jgi:hypothetical protein
MKRKAKNQANIKTWNKHKKNMIKKTKNRDKEFFYCKKTVSVVATSTEQGWKKQERCYCSETNRELQYNFWLHL